MHQFNPEIAKQIGVDEAIILQSIVFWISKNKANGRHFYKNRYWSYNSYAAFEELFPYWSIGQIRRILASLEKQGVILTDYFSKGNYNRTKYYALTDDFIYLIGGVEINRTVMSESTERGVEINRTITDILLTDNNNTNNNPLPPKNKKTEDLPDWLEKETWEDWKQHRIEKGKKLTATQSAKQIKKLSKFKESGQDPNEIINRSIENGWIGLFELEKKTTENEGNKPNIMEAMNEFEF